MIQKKFKLITYSLVAMLLLSLATGCDSGGIESPGSGKASLVLDKTMVTIDSNATATITATAKTADGSDDSITAESGDTAVATVSVSGLVVTVTGVKAGTVTVTVTSGSGLEQTCEVTLMPVSLAGSWQVISWRSGDESMSFADVFMDIDDDNTSELGIERVTTYFKVSGNTMYFFHNLAGVTYRNGYNGEDTNNEGVDNPEYFEKLWATEDVEYEENAENKTIVSLNGDMTGNFTGTESLMSINFYEADSGDAVIMTWEVRKVADSVLDDAVSEPKDNPYYNFHISMEHLTQD